MQYLRRGVLAGIVLKIFENREIIRIHKKLCIHGEELTKMVRSPRRIERDGRTVE